MENKWVRGAIPALLLHMSIGTVYCWGTFSNEISEYIGWSTSTVGWAFSLAIFFLGMSAAFLGGMVEKNIHRSSLIATVCFGGGMLGTAFFIWLGGKNPGTIIPLIGIFLCYGFIMGVGLGTGYLSPVKTLTLWFKETPGLATGLAVAGFGAAKAIASPIMTAILNTGENGVWQMFLYMGLVYIVLMFIGHLLLKKPSDWHEPQKVEKGNRAIDVIAKQPVTFVGIWLMFYLNIAAGLALIHMDKSIFSNILGISTATTATLLAVSSVFNAGGRLVFSAISDKLKDRNTVYKIIFAMSIALTAIVMLIGGLNEGAKSGVVVVITVALLLMVNAGYGGGFSTLPNLLGDRFGKANYSAIHGIALSAWGIAGLTGNQFAQIIEHATGKASSVLYMTLGMYIVAMVCSMVMVNFNKNK